MLNEGLEALGTDEYKPDGKTYSGVSEESGLEAILHPALKIAEECAFSGCEKLKSVYLNDGLEKLGAKETVGGSGYEGGVFLKSAIESVRLPFT